MSGEGGQPQTGAHLCVPPSTQGASCRFADFEDSNLSFVNMRVACLKNASLRQCTLRLVGEAWCRGEWPMST